MRDPSLFAGLCLCVGLGALACDLQPPPRRQAPATGSADVPSPLPPAVVPGDGGEPMLVASDVCLETAVKIADMIIAATTDPTQKAAIEQDRTKLVRRSAETCTRDAWSEAARRCFNAAKSPADLEACGRELPKP